MAKKITDLVNFASSSAKVERYPTAEDRLVKGNPEQNNQLHFAVKDKFFAGEWGADVGCWKIKYSENEYFHILSGKSILRDLDGNELVMVAGDKICVPAGFEGEWEVVEPTQKIYVIYEE
ncbi:cupin domain-containing protein [Dasania marina]|uniref:cupin domain-containing protein n=1 Tax=Dasania marina TaxID=471499 RepID=UPI00036D4EFC|nr:cupin domain-containing protein [Dasania marina]|tara:strand:- start:64475 stop:64834 length:360 start_codon:yes stop_codon:yes gene_type:complete